MEHRPSIPAIQRRVYIGATAETVWPWLVEPGLSRQYHLSDLEARPLAPGDPVRYFSKLGGQLLIDGVVEELLEGRKLSHSFQFQFEPLEPPSRVTYELLRHGDLMCRLDLRHEDCDPDGETYASVSASWDVVLSSLKTLIETGRPLPWPARKNAPGF